MVLVDLNPQGLQDMSKHRDAERKALISTDFSEAVKENNIQFITYRDLIK